MDTKTYTIELDNERLLLVRRTIQLRLYVLQDRRTELESSIRDGSYTPTTGTDLGHVLNEMADLEELLDLHLAS